MIRTDASAMTLTIIVLPGNGIRPRLPSSRVPADLARYWHRGLATPPREPEMAGGPGSRQCCRHNRPAPLQGYAHSRPASAPCNRGNTANGWRRGLLASSGLAPRRGAIAHNRSRRAPARRTFCGDTGSAPVQLVVVCHKWQRPPRLAAPSWFSPKHRMGTRPPIQRGRLRVTRAVVLRRGTARALRRARDK